MTATSSARPSRPKVYHLAFRQDQAETIQPHILKPCINNVTRSKMPSIGSKIGAELQPGMIVVLISSLQQLLSLLSSYGALNES